MNSLPAYVRAMTTCDSRPGNAPGYDSHATRPEAKSKRKAACGKCKRLFYANKMLNGVCRECNLPPKPKQTPLEQLIEALAAKLEGVTQ